MTDQPVTPDREALIRKGAVSMANVMRLPEWMQRPALGRDMTPVAELVVGALLPLLTEALDRARQQGWREGRDEAAKAIEAYNPQFTISEIMHESYQTALDAAARLARGADRKDEE